MGKVRPLHRVNGQGQADRIGVDVSETTQNQFKLDYLPGQSPLEACDDCGDELPLSAFRIYPYRKGGYRFICSHCSKDGVRSKAAVRRLRGVAKKASYMQPTSDDKCGICDGGGDERGLFLDHDHNTGYFRGWLCNSCNSGIGHFDDDPDRLRSAIRYLTAEVEVNLNP